jgi:hypothetical protein
MTKNGYIHMENDGFFIYFSLIHDQNDFYEMAQHKYPGCSFDHHDQRRPSSGRFSPLPPRRLSS